MGSRCFHRWQWMPQVQSWDCISMATHETYFAHGETLDHHLSALLSA
jgi:hypothetical protein